MAKLLLKHNAPINAQTVVCSDSEKNLFLCIVPIQVRGRQNQDLLKITPLWKGRGCSSSLLGPLYTTPGCFLAQVESPRRVTVLQSNVYKSLHENSTESSRVSPLAG